MTSAFIEETARAWRIDPQKVRELANWTERKVDPHNRAVVFAKLLRQYMGTQSSEGDIKLENQHERGRAYQRYNRASLALER